MISFRNKEKQGDMQFSKTNRFSRNFKIMYRKAALKIMQRLSNFPYPQETEEKEKKGKTGKKTKTKKQKKKKRRRKTGR